MNNFYFAQCLDLLLFHLHERGIVNFIENTTNLEHTYSIMGYGSGANIALYYVKEMMMNDQISALKSLVLINPYIEVDQTMNNALLNII